MESINCSFYFREGAVWCWKSLEMHWDNMVGMATDVDLDRKTGKFGSLKNWVEQKLNMREMPENNAGKKMMLDKTNKPKCIF